MHKKYKKKKLYMLNVYSRFRWDGSYSIYSWQSYRTLEMAIDQGKEAIRKYAFTRFEVVHMKTKDKLYDSEDYT